MKHHLDIGIIYFELTNSTSLLLRIFCRYIQAMPQFQRNARILCIVRDPIRTLQQRSHEGQIPGLPSPEPGCPALPGLPGPGPGRPTPALSLPDPGVHMRAGIGVPSPRAVDFHRTVWKEGATDPRTQLSMVIRGTPLPTDLRGVSWPFPARRLANRPNQRAARPRKRANTTVEAHAPIDEGHRLESRAAQPHLKAAQPHPGRPACLRCQVTSWLRPAIKDDPCTPVKHGEERAQEWQSDSKCKLVDRV